MGEPMPRWYADLHDVGDGPAAPEQVRESCREAVAYIDRMRASAEPLRTLDDVEAVCTRHGLGLEYASVGLSWMWGSGRVTVHAMKSGRGDNRPRSVCTWALSADGETLSDTKMSGSTLTVAVLDAAIVAALAAQEVTG